VIDALKTIRQNRKGLRLLGLGITSQVTNCVETYETLRQKNKRVSVAAAGRLIGVTRQRAHQLMNRAETAGLVIKIGRTYILNVKTVLAWSARFVAERAAAIRSKALRSCKRFTKLPYVKDALTHTTKNIKTKVFVSEMGRIEARAALAACYIPAHLRKHR